MAKKLTRGNHRIVTNAVRLSYAHALFEKGGKGEINDGKYSVTLLIDKNDKDTLDVLNKEFEEIKQEAKTNLFKGKNLPSTFRIPLRDGDTEANESNQENYKGYMFLSAKNANEVAKYDVKGHPTEDQTVIYSGCWAVAILELFAYNSNGASGISCKIQGIRKTRDDDSFGGGETKLNEDEFGIENDFDNEFEDL